MAQALSQFYPPQQQRLLVRLIQSLAPTLIRWLYKIEITVTDDAIARLKALEDARLVYICNHPTLEDGVAMFGLSAKVGQPFHYIVARESFKGLLGKFLQWLGCYSIRRGLGDRTSIAQTLSLLKSPNCRLVIFPEGGCSYQNDTIMPLRSGAIQMPLQVMGQLAKQAKQPSDMPDLYLIPISLKYRYTEPMEPVIEQTLSGLEQTLKIQPAPGQEFYGRLVAIANRVLTRLETEYGLSADTSGNWNDRIDQLRRHVIAQCERKLRLEPALGLPIRERVYKVQAILETNEAGTAADEALYWTTVRLLNFDAIYDGYVAENPTPERFLDTLMRLEREVYQIEHLKPKASRQAIFNVGEPINLKAYVSDFRRDKSATVAALTEQLQTVLQANLETLAN
ncbi:MAG: 1-acyl-sn-glycerol-3-phosphate acyltransferase [Leptolyngbya sp. SIO4C1]|nr:1-acyl-sn-glycerol-3-phosphate acyltransferase [Leptolyngbya sp. SIO4C1]